MLTPPDGKPEGKKTGYLDQPVTWRDYDPIVFDLLKSVSSDQGEHRLNLIEGSGIVPNATYFNDPLSDKAIERQIYFEAALDHFKQADLIFFDPDNGFERKATPKGRKYSSKFVYRDEIAAAYQQNHSIVLYQHFPMEKKEVFIPKLGTRLSAVAPDARLWCFRTPFAVFVMLVHPQNPQLLVAAANAPAGWRPKFVNGAELVPKGDPVVGE